MTTPNPGSQDDLVAKAARIRRLTLSELLHAGYGHFGGSLSIVEALAALYGRVMKVDPARPDWEERDYFVLSKGHAAPALYAALADTGYFGVDVLDTLNANGTSLPSHADRNKVTGVEMTTGSMGQGISVAAGIAYGLREQVRSNRVFALVGDGELNEGQCWEAAQFIAHRELTNLVVLVDDNKRQLDGLTEEISRTFDFVAKFQAFGFDAVRVDGQDPNAIADVLLAERSGTRPLAVILDTTKGAGVQYIAALRDNHHVRLDDAGRAEIEEAIRLLSAELDQEAEVVEEGVDR